MSAVVIVLAFAGIMVAFVQSMVFPIVPQLPSLLHAAPSDTAWAVTVTLLVGAVATPVIGRLGDMFGKRRLLLTGAVAMVAGSAVCALSGSLAPFLTGRALQGLAAGVIPLGVSLMRDVVPAERLTTATSVMIGSTGVGGALGLPAAALIADAFDWHVLFWVAAAVGAIAVVLVLTIVPETPLRSGGRFDVIGAAGLTAGLLCLLIAVAEGTDWGWGSRPTLALAAGAVLILPLWGWFQLRTRVPLVDLRTAARAQVLFTHLAALALGFALFATSLVLPQLLQTPHETGYGLGESLIVTGLVMAPQGLVMMAVSPLAARVIAARGARTTLMLGAAIVALGYLLAMALMAEIWQLILASSLVAAGVGIALGSLPSLVMAGVPRSGTASAISFNTLMRAVGTSISSAVAGVVLTRLTIDLQGTTLPTQNALRTVLAIGAGAAVAALAFACLLPRKTSTDGSHPQAAPAAADA